jgi:hypothetical protein
VNDNDLIIHYNFTTRDYNIGFSIEKLGQFECQQGTYKEVGNKEIVRYAMYDSHLKPISVITYPKNIGNSKFTRKRFLQSNMAQFILLHERENP